MKITKILLLSLFLMVGSAYGQYLYQGFNEEPADLADYWKYYEDVIPDPGGGPSGIYQISGAADPTLGFANLSYVDSPVNEGAKALQVEYSVHNAESWGGYTKIEHWHPDEQMTYDWTPYETLSFWYNNTVPQSEATRVTFRLNLHDVSDADVNTYTNEDCEYWYSFEYILDAAPGWNEYEIPLINGGDVYDGALGFNLTTWAGIAGNGELDLDKIKGFTFEFSVGGAGEGDAVSGTIVIDAITLKGSNSVLTLSPGFEDGDTDGDGTPDNWGGWQSALDGWGSLSHISTSSHSAYPKLSSTSSIEVFDAGGEYFAELGVDAGNGYAVIFQNDFPVQPREGWRLGADIRDISPAPPGGDFAALKMEVFDASANKIAEWEDIQTGVNNNWNNFAAEHIMPEGAATLNIVLVATKWLNDGIPAVYGFDNITLVNTGIPDFDPPTAPPAVAVFPDANFNLVTWTDVDGETNETYTVYRSHTPIDENNINEDYVHIVGSGIVEGLGSFTDWLYRPQNDQSMTFYYAVTCTDESSNESLPNGTTEATTNTAMGIPVIHLQTPDFQADGDLSEWINAGIEPFVITPDNGNVAAGTVTDADDLSASVYMAIDNDFLYVAADVIDDSYGYGDGNWWDQDAFQMFIGLYNIAGPPHSAILRDGEPDYIFYANEERLQGDYSGGEEIYAQGDADFFFENTGSYITEFKIALDYLAQGEDDRFTPAHGMRVPLDLYFHDNDNGTWEGNLGFSKNSTDKQWQTVQEWAYTWIVDPNGAELLDVDGAENSELADFRLNQNFPNPFNPTTTISYSLPKDAQVKITVYNMLGNPVAILVNENMKAGLHTASFNGTNLSSGIYMYKIEADNFVQTRKMMLVK